MAHADVVVASKGAVVLALAFTDFLDAFKEVVGLRQQVRGSEGFGFKTLNPKFE